MLLLAQGHGAVIEGLIFLELQVLALVSFQHLIVLTQHGICQGLSDIVGVAVTRLYFYIVFLGVHTQGQVAGKGPRRSGPCQDICVFSLGLKAGNGGTLLYILITLGHLMGGQRGAAARAVGNHLKALVQKTLVPNLLKSPPLGLDKAVVIGYIGIVHISPEANGVGEILPHALVLPDAFLTFFDKRLQTILLNLLLAVQSQLLLNFQLHRQAVGVPSGLSRHHIPLHGPVSGNHILDYTGLHMADMRLAVGSWRSVIEYIGLAALPHFNAFLKDVLCFPELLHFFFPFHKLKVCGDFVIHNVFLRSIHDRFLFWYVKKIVYPSMKQKRLPSRTGRKP